MTTATVAEDVAALLKTDATFVAEQLRTVRKR